MVANLPHSYPYYVPQYSIMFSWVLLMHVRITII
jgi:hypothetical protein